MCTVKELGTSTAWQKRYVALRRLLGVRNRGLHRGPAEHAGSDAHEPIPVGGRPRALRCAGGLHRSCHHERVPAVPAGHGLPGRDLCVVPHLRRALLGHIHLHTARLHNAVGAIFILVEVF